MCFPAKEEAKPTEPKVVIDWEKMHREHDKYMAEKWSGESCELTQNKSLLSSCSWDIHTK